MPARAIRLVLSVRVSVHARRVDRETHDPSDDQLVDVPHSVPSSGPSSGPAAPGRPSLAVARTMLITVFFAASFRLAHQSSHPIR